MHETTLARGATNYMNSSIHEFSNSCIPNHFKYWFYVPAGTVLGVVAASEHKPVCIREPTQLQIYCRSDDITWVDCLRVFLKIMSLVLFTKAGWVYGQTCSNHDQSGIILSEKFVYVSECQMDMDRLGCDRFKGDPDLRDCSKEAGLLAKAGSFATGQLRCAYNAATALFSFDPDQSFYDQKFEAQRLRFLDECQKHDDCIGQLFRAAKGYEASESDIKSYANSWRISRRMDYLWNLATLKQGGGGEWYQRQVNQISEKSNWKNTADEKVPSWKEVKDSIHSQYDRYWCLNDAARAEMACFVATVLMGGGQAIAQLSKMPRFLKLAKMAGPRRISGQLQSTEAMRDALAAKKASPRFSERAPELARHWSQERVNYWENEIPAELRRKLTDGERKEIESVYLQDILFQEDVVSKRRTNIWDDKILEKLIDQENLKIYVERKIDLLLGENRKPYDKKRLSEVRILIWNDVKKNRNLISAIYDHEGKSWNDLDSAIDRIIQRGWVKLTEKREGRLVEAVAQREQLHADQRGSKMTLDEINDVTKMARREEGEYLAREAEAMSEEELMHKKMAEIPVPTSAIVARSQISIADACPGCPREIRFVRDSHYDSHIWERIGINVPKPSRITVQTDPVILRYEIETYLKGISSGGTPNSDQVRKRIGDLRRQVARDGKPTSIWTASKRDEVIRDIKRIDLKSEPIREKDPNTISFVGEHAGTKFRLVICQRRPCNNPNLNPGDVSSLYPICGPAVFKIPNLAKLTKVQRALEGGQADVVDLQALIVPDTCP